MREAPTVVPRDKGESPKAVSYRGALQSYLRSIREYELLTRSGEYRLATACREGVEQAKHALVQANLRLVFKLAMDYRHTRVGLEELIAEGNLGLIEAVNRFDPTRGVRFANYASWWIRKYIIQAIDRQAHQTTSPTRAVVADDDAEAPVRRRQRILSYDDFMQNSSDRHLLETIAVAGSVDPGHIVLERQLAEALAAVLPRLPDQERTVLSTHYGLDGAAPRTLQEIGRDLGLTRERVRQIEQRGIQRARRLLQRGSRA